jgi:hypothetical protein
VTGAARRAPRPVVSVGLLRGAARISSATFSANRVNNWRRGPDLFEIKSGLRGLPNEKDGHRAVSVYGVVVSRQRLRIFRHSIH